MSVNWSDGYFTEAEYTYGYYREISPVFQRFCLLLQGYIVEDGSESVHCELGFGQGVSINVHAAAIPGRYVGTDFNPSHAAHAMTLANAAGHGASLFDDSFEEMLRRDDLPLFDSISLHGIWTWVSRENHRTLIEFARRWLRPGGTFYVSYNCFPGWSPAYPLRQLLAAHDRFSAAVGDVGTRVDAALGFASDLIAAKPLYAQAVPGLEARLAKLKEQNRHYLAHEYFNREWNCMYFADVADALAGAKLEFAATAAPLEMVDAINFTPEASGFLRGIKQPLLREQARDYFVNQQFRRDIYVRGARRAAPGELMERLLSLRFALVHPSDQVPFKAKGALGEADLQEAVYRPLIEALAARGYAPKTLREVLELAPRVSFAQAQQAITVLAGIGAVAPCQSEGSAKQVKKRCETLNRHICDRARHRNEIETLVSPVLGGGVPVGRFQQLFLLAAWTGLKKPEEWAAFAWKELAAQGQRLLRDGKVIAGAEENLAELNRQTVEFASQRLPVLKALQIA